MTARHKKLINAEVQRHIALALASSEPTIKRSHMEVAEALTAALVAAEERTVKRSCKNPNWAPRIGLSLRHLLARRKGCCREGRISREP